MYNTSIINNMSKSAWKHAGFETSKDLFIPEELKLSLEKIGIIIHNEAFGPAIFSRKFKVWISSKSPPEIQQIFNNCDHNYFFKIKESFDCQWVMSPEIVLAICSISRMDKSEPAKKTILDFGFDCVVSKVLFDSLSIGKT